ncbi:DUF6567 family protein [Carboxylicivirga sp. M1479]|uniref:DUF6567 family protein n=1 Tax=Carboxylicivirga sp. M1479 TaxID=2594476 RepID=UPI001177B146|nr:DUF6567 family protein [Carboxylicivirga sp. M1479]TRX72671.1 hypothetical protein FNN09_01650 [Carboxylicivirga sp. M1479]
MKHLLFLLPIAIILSSCATHTGVMTGNATISDANFNVVGLAVGSSKTKHVFGMGGLGKDALVFEAKRNLYSNYPLKKGQALANVTVDFKRSYYPFVNNTMAVISADIFDFNTRAADSTFNTIDRYSAKYSINPKLNIHQNVVAIINNKPRSVRIVELSYPKTTVLYKDDKDNVKFKRVANKKIDFLKANTSDEIQVGNFIEFTYFQKTYTGVVKSMEDDHLLVSTFLFKDTSSLVKIKYDDILKH